MLLREVVEDFISAKQSEVAPRTVEFYERALALLVGGLGELPIKEVSRRDLRQFRASHLGTRRWQPATLHKNLRAVRSFFKWALEETYIEENPALTLRLPKLPDQRPKAISSADFQALVVQALEDVQDGLECAVRDLAILLFMADTGCRVGGLIGLKLEDLDMDHKQAVLLEKGRGGQGKARVVFFNDEVRASLRSWLAVRESPKNAPEVFLTRRGRKMDKSTVYRLLKRLGARTGIQGRCNPHSLRHRFALRLLENGADLGTVAQLMGHSDIEVTHQFYARWSTQQLQERHTRFSRLFAGTVSLDEKIDHADDC